MQTNEQILSKLAEHLKSRDLLHSTQKQYLWISRVFIENWLNRDASEMDEEDVKDYLVHLKDDLKYSDSTISLRNTALRHLLGIVTGNNSYFAEARRTLIKNGCLQEPREAFLQYLRDLGYVEKGLKSYRWMIKCVDQFMRQQDKAKYSRDVGMAFLAERAESGRHTSGVLKHMGVVVRRFDCFMENGEYVYILPFAERESPPQFAEDFSKYLEYLRMRGLRESTVMLNRNIMQKALLKFDSVGIQNLSEINPEFIYEAYEKMGDKRSLYCPLRGFLRYIYEAGIIGLDYSEIVPPVRRPHSIPSVYTQPETEKLLNYAEADDTANKRNSAVVLLALRLGMRSGDIANLKISDVDFKNKNICYVQEKTLVPQRLELLPELEGALLTYISTARPVSDIPNIFLMLNAPIRAMTSSSVYWAVRSRLKKSGVDTGGRKCGGHSLRMTLASELVAEKVPYDAVRKILGHEDPASAKHYVEFDVESLRLCAIEIPPVMGKLAAYMAARTGGCLQ